DFIFGTNDYAGNGGVRIYHPTTDTRKQYAAARFFNGKLWNGGVFNIFELGDRSTSVGQVTDGLSKTLLFCEGNHGDRGFDRLYTAYPLANWSGWAWTKVENSVGDNLGHAAVPINYTIPPGSTGSSTNLINDRLCAWGSYHAGGANFCLCDSSVSFYSDSM